MDFLNPLEAYGLDDEPDDDWDRECGFPGCGCPTSEVCNSVHSGLCPECGDEYVQVQNGDWVCPGCDLWLY